jgi:uracil phosphoribosyltransferase
MRFRRNLERLGEVFAYEISKTLNFQKQEVSTQLGIKKTYHLSQDVVLLTILRAGLPLHQGLLNYFDKAENAFIGAYRGKHDKKEAFASQRLFFAINLLDSVNDGNWQIVKDAFVIEVSKKDLEDIRTSKTPNKLLYRIGLVREANEFPTELIEA